MSKKTSQANILIASCFSCRALYFPRNDGCCRQPCGRCPDRPTQLPLRPFPCECSSRVNRRALLEATGGRITRNKGDRRALHCRLVSSKSLSGAVLKAEPDSVPLRVSLLGVLTAGCSYTLIRKIGHRASATHTVLYFAMTSTLASPMFMLMRGEEWVMPTQPVWIMLLLLVGLFGLGAQVCNFSDSL